MRRLVACALLFVLSGSSAQAAAPRLRALDVGVEASLSGVRNFRFRAGFGGEMRVLLQSGEVTVTDWPLRASAASDVTFRLMQVYAPDAKIYRVDERGLTIEVPRSTWTFASGVGRDGGSAWLAIDEEGRVRSALSSSFDGDLEIVEASEGSGLFVLRPVEQTAATQWACGIASPLASVPADSREAMPPLIPEAIPVLSSRHTAVIGVDTDTEFMAMKGTTNATNFIASLISQMNVTYERDVNVTLLQGQTLLRSSDPYTGGSGNADSAKLAEFRNEWNVGCTAAYAGQCSGARALAMLMSGKGTGGGASGIASLGGLCGSTGYSFNQMFFNSGGTATFQEARLVAHEIGHNLGSPHSNCYPSPPDTCQSECAGNTTCPANGTYQGVLTSGTIMSYCHLYGCSTQLVFHPRTLDDYFTPNVVDGATAPNQCVFPAYSLTSLTPNNGPTTGGTPVVIKGLALTGTNSVTFGGTPATAVVVVNDTTVTAVAPAHATGAVTVALGNSSGGSASLPNAFFYGNTSAASSFFTLTPCRIVDTRGFGAPIQGGALAAGAQRTWTLTGVCGVPASAKAVSANVTITSAVSTGLLAFYPGNAFPLGTSTLNYGAGQTRANNSMLELATNGAGSVGVQNASAGSVHVILDVNGYFE